MARLVATRNRLIQFKIVHMAYFTPQRLHCWQPNCWQCGEAPADIFPCLLVRLNIQEFWAAVVQVIYLITPISVPQTVSLCLLGLVNHLAFTRASRTLLSLLVFYARKAVVLVWKSDRPPSLDCWKKLIDLVIPLYKITYLFHGCPKKFHKV